MKHTLIPDALYWASFDRFSLRLPGECVADCSASGSVDDAVAYWVDRIRFDETNLLGEVQATPDAIREELSEYGAWDDEELADDEQNRHRIVWCAACNVAEDETPDCSEPLVPSGETGPFANLGI